MDNAEDFLNTHFPAVTKKADSESDPKVKKVGVYKREQPRPPPCKHDWQVYAYPYGLLGEKYMLCSKCYIRKIEWVTNSRNGNSCSLKKGLNKK